MEKKSNSLSSIDKFKESIQEINDNHFQREDEQKKNNSQRNTKYEDQKITKIRENTQSNVKHNFNGQNTILKNKRAKPDNSDKEVNIDKIEFQRPFQPLKNNKGNLSKAETRINTGKSSKIGNTTKSHITEIIDLSQLNNLCDLNDLSLKEDNIDNVDNSMSNSNLTSFRKEKSSKNNAFGNTSSVKSGEFKRRYKPRVDNNIFIKRNHYLEEQLEKKLVNSEAISKYYNSTTLENLPYIAKQYWNNNLMTTKFNKISNYWTEIQSPLIKNYFVKVLENTSSLMPINTLDEKSTVMVNSKQAERILKMRHLRNVVEFDFSKCKILQKNLEKIYDLKHTDNEKPKKEKYIYYSRHAHAVKRERGKNGRFLSKAELEELKNKEEKENREENRMKEDKEDREDDNCSITKKELEETNSNDYSKYLISNVMDDDKVVRDIVDNNNVVFNVNNKDVYKFDSTVQNANNFTIILNEISNDNENDNNNENQSDYSICIRDEEGKEVYANDNHKKDKINEEHK